MVYHVRARLKEDTARDLFRKLNDGTVLEQKPDGAEIVRSMNRAVVTGNGTVEWSETCYCSTPLAHERATVYDHHFEGITTELLEDHKEYKGAPFMEHLSELADT